MKRILLIAITFVVAISAFSQSQSADQTFDIVILHGRVMDPESGLDAARNVGVNGNRIAAITEAEIRGRKTIEARGLAVAPGFIDLHSHGQDAENYRYKAMDGVTTALELEIGVADIDQWYTERQGKTLINYGATIGHVPTRMRLMHDSGTFLPHDTAATTVATSEQIAEMQRDLEHGLARGALGVGFGIGYVPAATRWEIIQMFSAATEYHAPAFVHLRGGNTPDSPMASLEEALAAAEVTGAPLHVVHISSTGLHSTPQMLATIEGARQHGLDVTTECYPYTAAMTDLGSALFGPGWQQREGITYKDLQWVETGERLTQETFEKYRKQGGMVIIHSIPAEIAQLAVSSPLTMIASDGLILNGKGHPRGAGTYAHVLGYYVRQQHALSLMEALRKMTLMPAQRLQARAPMMQNKGRVKVGADADLTIFDPERVIDKATYEKIAYSEGIEYVFVGGVPVVNAGKLAEGVTPGEAIRAPVQ
ncbi:MAG TPA: amidohydrolase family protein [Terriglobales bacterium]|nr:amidohydrolase family protein [Terriglobales bacterium]